MNGMAQQVKEEMKEEINGIKKGMEANTNRMEANTNKMEANTNGMREEMKKMRGEMRQMGQCLQAGIMAPPRAGTNELGGSATAVGPAVGAGEDRVIRETCWGRRVRVTEAVTVTQAGKLIGVTETCTSETRREVTEITETREMGTVEERLHGTDGVKEDAHTHRGSGGQWGRARGACRDPVQAAGWPPSGTRGGSIPP